MRWSATTSSGSGCASPPGPGCGRRSRRCSPTRWRCASTLSSPHPLAAARPSPEPGRTPVELFGEYLGSQGRGRPAGGGAVPHAARADHRADAPRAAGDGRLRRPSASPPPSTSPGAEYFALVGPTGSGKSTVIDAMTFALYGSVPRWDNARTVALALAPTVARGTVRFVFDVAGRAGGTERYVVARELRRAASGGVSVRTARLERLRDPAGTGAVEEETEPVADGAPATTKAVEELLGLPFGDFTTCVVLPQGEFAEFLHTEPRKRQETLVRLLGLGVYDVIAKEANAEARSQEQRAQVLTEQLGGLPRRHGGGRAGRRRAGHGARRGAGAGRRGDAGAHRRRRRAGRGRGDGRAAVRRAVAPHRPRSHPPGSPRWPRVGTLSAAAAAAAAGRARRRRARRHRGARGARRRSGPRSAGGGTAPPRRAGGHRGGAARGARAAGEGPGIRGDRRGGRRGGPFRRRGGRAQRGRPRRPRSRSRATWAAGSRRSATRFRAVVAPAGLDALAGRLAGAVAARDRAARRAGRRGARRRRGAHHPRRRT